LNGLGPEANDQFTKIILGLRDTVSQALQRWASVAMHSMRG
jgi:hypothetical protein